MPATQWIRPVFSMEVRVGSGLKITSPLSQENIYSRKPAAELVLVRVSDLDHQLALVAAVEQHQ